MSCWFLEPKVYYVKWPTHLWQLESVQIRLIVFISNSLLFYQYKPFKCQMFCLKSVLTSWSCIIIGSTLTSNNLSWKSWFTVLSLFSLILLPVSPWNIFLLHDIQTLWTIYPKYVILHFTFIHTVMIPNAADSECLILIFIV